MNQKNKHNNGGKGAILIFSSWRQKTWTKIMSAIIALIFLFNLACPAYARQGNYGERGSLFTFGMGALAGAVTNVFMIAGGGGVGTWAAMGGSIIGDTLGYLMYRFDYENSGTPMGETPLSRRQFYSMVASIVVSVGINFIAGAASSSAESVANQAIEASTDAAREAAEEAVRSVLEQTTEAAAEGMARAAAEQAAEAVLEEVVKSALEEAGKTMAEDAIKSLVEDAAKSIAQDAVESVLQSAAEETAKEVTKSFIQKILGVWNPMTGFTNLIIKPLGKVLGYAAEKLGNFFSTIVSLFKSAQPAVEQTASSATQAVVNEAVGSTVESVVDQAAQSAAEQVAEAAMEGASKSFIQKVLDVGWIILQKIWSPIWNTLKGIYNLITNPIKTITDFIKYIEEKFRYLADPSKNKYFVYGQKGQLGKALVNTAADITIGTLRLVIVEGVKDELEEAEWDETVAEIAAQTAGQYATMFITPIVLQAYGLVFDDILHMVDGLEVVSEQGGYLDTNEAAMIEQRDNLGNELAEGSAANRRLIAEYKYLASKEDLSDEERITKDKLEFDIHSFGQKGDDFITLVKATSGRGMFEPLRDNQGRSVSGEHYRGFWGTLRSGVATMGTLGLAPIFSAATKILILRALEYDTHYGDDKNRIYDNLKKMVLANAVGNIVGSMVSNCNALGSWFAGTGKKEYVVVKAQTDEQGNIVVKEGEPVTYTDQQLEQRFGENYAKVHDENTGDDYLWTKDAEGREEIYKEARTIPDNPWRTYGENDYWKATAKVAAIEVGGALGEIAWGKFAKNNNLDPDAFGELAHLAAATVTEGVINLARQDSGMRPKDEVSLKQVKAEGTDAVIDNEEVIPEAVEASSTGIEGQLELAALSETTATLPIEEVEGTEGVEYWEKAAGLTNEIRPSGYTVKSVSQDKQAIGLEGTDNWDETIKLRDMLQAQGYTGKTIDELKSDPANSEKLKTYNLDSQKQYYAFTKGDDLLIYQIASRTDFAQGKEGPIGRYEPKKYDPTAKDLGDRVLEAVVATAPGATWSTQHPGTGRGAVLDQWNTYDRLGRRIDLVARGVSSKDAITSQFASDLRSQASQAIAGSSGSALSRLWLDPLEEMESGALYNFEPDSEKKLIYEKDIAKQYDEIIAVLSEEESAAALLAKRQGLEEEIKSLENQRKELTERREDLDTNRGGAPSVLVASLGSLDEEIKSKKEQQAEAQHRMNVLLQATWPYLTAETSTQIAELQAELVESKELQKDLDTNRGGAPSSLVARIASLEQEISRLKSQGERIILSEGEEAACARIDRAWQANRDEIISQAKQEKAMTLAKVYDSGTSDGTGTMYITGYQQRDAGDWVRDLAVIESLERLGQQRVEDGIMSPEEFNALEAIIKLARAGNSATTTGTSYALQVIDSTGRPGPTRVIANSLIIDNTVRGVEETLRQELQNIEGVDIAGLDAAKRDEYVANLRIEKGMDWLPEDPATAIRVLLALSKGVRIFAPEMTLTQETSVDNWGRPKETSYYTQEYDSQQGRWVTVAEKMKTTHYGGPFGQALSETIDQRDIRLPSEWPTETITETEPGSASLVVDRQKETQDQLEETSQMALAGEGVFSVSQEKVRSDWLALPEATRESYLAELVDIGKQIWRSKAGAIRIKSDLSDAELSDLHYLALMMYAKTDDGRAWDQLSSQEKKTVILESTIDRRAFARKYEGDEISQDWESLKTKPGYTAPYTTSYNRPGSSADRVDVAQVETVYLPGTGPVETKTETHETVSLGPNITQDINLYPIGQGTSPYAGPTYHISFSDINSGPMRDPRMYGSIPFALAEAEVVRISKQMADKKFKGDNNVDAEIKRLEELGISQDLIAKIREGLQSEALTQENRDSSVDIAVKIEEGYKDLARWLQDNYNGEEITVEQLAEMLEGYLTARGLSDENKEIVKFTDDDRDEGLKRLFARACSPEQLETYIQQPIDRERLEAQWAKNIFINSYIKATVDEMLAKTSQEKYAEYSRDYDNVSSIRVSEFHDFQGRSYALPEWSWTEGSSLDQTGNLSSVFRRPQIYTYDKGQIEGLIESSRFDAKDKKNELYIDFLNTVFASSIAGSPHTFVREGPLDEYLEAMYEYTTERELSEEDKKFAPSDGVIRTKGIGTTSAIALSDVSRGNLAIEPTELEIAQFMTPAEPPKEETPVLKFETIRGLYRPGEQPKVSESTPAAEPQAPQAPVVSPTTAPRQAAPPKIERPTGQWEKIKALYNEPEESVSEQDNIESFGDAMREVGRGIGKGFRAVGEGFKEAYRGIRDAFSREETLEPEEVIPEPKQPEKTVIERAPAPAETVKVRPAAQPQEEIETQTAERPQRVFLPPSVAIPAYLSMKVAEGIQEFQSRHQASQQPEASQEVQPRRERTPEAPRQAESTAVVKPAPADTVKVGPTVAPIPEVRTPVTEGFRERALRTIVGLADRVADTGRSIGDNIRDRFNQWSTRPSAPEPAPKSPFYSPADYQALLESIGTAYGESSSYTAEMRSRLGAENFPQIGTNFTKHFVESELSEKAAHGDARALEALENLNETAISGNLRASVVQGFVYYVSYFPYGDDVTRRNNFSNIARIFVENEPNLYNPAVGKLTRSLIEGVANFLLRYHLQESNPLTNAELKDFISNLSTESIYALLTAPEEYLFGDFYRVGFERIIEDTRGAPDFFGCLRNKGIPESAFPDILYAASKSGNLQELATGHPEIIGGSVEIILSDMMKQLQFSDTPNLAPLANTVDVFLRDKSTRAGFEEKLVAFYRGLSNTDSNRRYLDAILSTYWDRLSSSSRNLLMQDGFKVQELADYSRIPYSRLFNGGNGSELVIKQIFQEDDPFHGTANRLQQKGYELVAQEPNALVYAKTIQGRTVKHALIFMPSASATDREPLSSMPASIRAHRGHSFQTTGSLDGRGAEATCLISLGCRGFAYASSVIDNYNNDSQPHYYIPIYNGGDERGRAEFVPNTEFLISLGEDLAKGKATGIETWGELAKQNYYFRSGYVLRPDHPIVTLSIELDRRRNNNPDLTIADNSWQATGQATWDSNRRMINR